MSHGGGGGLKSAEKVLRIIWMAPKYMMKRSDPEKMLSHQIFFLIGIIK